MSEKRTHSDYLHKAAMYDLLALFFKYSNPNLHMHYYFKHLKYMNKAVNSMQFYGERVHETAKIKIIHTSPDAPNVDIYINGKRMIRDLPFKHVSNVLTLQQGKYHIDIYPAGNMVDSVLNKTVTVEHGKSYTWAIIDSVKKMRLLIYQNQPDVPTNESKVRFIHLSPNTSAIDIAVKDRDVIFPKVAYKQATEYLPLSPMTVDLEAREGGTKHVILPMPKVHFKPNVTYSIFFVGMLHGEPALQTIMIQD